MYDLAHADSRAAFDALDYDLDRDVQRWTAIIGIPLFGLVTAAYFKLGLDAGGLVWVVCLGLFFAIRRGLLLLWRRRAPNRLVLSMDEVAKLEAAIAAPRAAEHETQ